MNKPEDYKHIRAWGRLLQSFETFILLQQEQAVYDNAPINAIFKDHNDKWFTLDQVKDSEIKAYLENVK